VFALTLQDAQTFNTIVLGTLLVCSLKARELFDTEATHFFISTCFVMCFNKQPSVLTSPLCVSTPLKEIIIGEYMY
jgi:hypothetical protein